MGAKNFKKLGVTLCTGPSENWIVPPRSHCPVFVSESNVPRTYSTVLNTPFPTEWGFSNVLGGRSHVSQPSWNLQRPTVVDHTLDTRSIAATDFGEGEGLTTVVMGISTTAATLLLPFLQEILRSQTEQVFSGCSGRYFRSEKGVGIVCGSRNGSIGWLRNPRYCHAFKV